MKPIFWTGYCNNERTAAISELEKIVSQYGFITHFKQFSDIALALSIELTEAHIDPLYEALNTYIQLDEAPKMNSRAEKEHLIFLNITFTKGTGDLKVEVPEVPG